MRRRASWLATPRSTLVITGVLALACCGSAPPAPATPPPSQDPSATWTIIHVERAQGALQHHGLSLRPRTTSIVVHDDVASFVAATGQTEPALRAWTTFGAVHVVDPRLWGDDSDATRTERLTHELCHAALLHRFPDEQAARAARVPRFFTEGACSVIAGQRRLPLSEVLARAGGALPLTIDAFARDPDMAYGAAHALAAVLVEQHGPLVFASVMSAAALDGGAGCVERALLALAGHADVAALWRVVVDSSAPPT